VAKPHLAVASLCQFPSPQPPWCCTHLQIRCTHGTCSLNNEITICFVEIQEFVFQDYT
jgi:hypothetical protein